MPTVGDVLEAVENFYPPSRAFDDDRIGLLVGALSRRVKRVLVALDPDGSAVEVAKRSGADLIISHHPVWWNRGRHRAGPPRTLLSHETAGRGAIMAASSDISIIAAHTNADFAEGGLCDAMADQLELLESRLCLMKGRSPVGRIGGINAVKWPVLRRKIRTAYGSGVRCSGVEPARIACVAVCSGSGSDLLASAFEAGADVLVTGDVKYHAARDAEALGDIRRREHRGGGFMLVDAGHFATERCFVPRTVKKLSKYFPKLPMSGFLARDPFKAL